ncbi:MAG TPA: winged helix-turn-helix domain-containing protein [Flavilitoribacter sp.]|nr:winged helix-turn-helix domain-containing protein [Flavilitoribacter sp.]
MESPVRFKSFSFFPEHGELVGKDEAGRETTTRLAPQPTRVLLLLLENSPDIVSHEKIKEVIWPDVQVDYERSLHFCIRQIRSALNDDPANPGFIETIPRRGYRWVAPIENGHVAKPPARRKSRVVLLSVLIGATALFGVFRFIQPLKTAGADGVAAPVRVAVMPFLDSMGFNGNLIANQLIESLTNQYKATCEVIGPTTTTGYYPNQLNRLIEEYHIDYLINGRYTNKPDKSGLLGEIIRARDGAHVWVKYFNEGSDDDAVTGAILFGFSEQLQH